MTARGPRGKIFCFHFNMKPGDTMNKKKGMSIGWLIILAVAAVLTLVSILVLLSILPVDAVVTAVILRYLWLFLGGTVIVTMVLDRLFERHVSNDKGEGKVQ